jgi:hypothetical protein
VVDLIDEAAELQRVLERHRFRFCFIGGLAVQHWGEPRLTRDIDVSVMAGFGDEQRVIDALLTHYSPRVSGAREFALMHRVLLLRSSTGIGIDVSMAALPFEDEMVQRSVNIEMIPGRTLRLCSAEDLVIMKVFAGRDTDMRDARSTVVRQSTSALDWSYVERHVQQLAELKDDPEMTRRLAGIRRP